MSQPTNELVQAFGGAVVPNGPDDFDIEEGVPSGIEEEPEEMDDDSGDPKPDLDRHFINYDR